MTQYYLAINGQQTGPFTKDELRSKSISPDTLIWCSGMPEWQQAGKVAELADIFVEVIVIDNGPAAGMPPLSEPQEDASWFAMMGDRRVGPSTISELVNMGINPNTPVWHEGFPDWMTAGRVQEIMVKINAARPSYGQNPQYGQQQPNYGQNPQYGHQPN
ncbi:MAG: DUF4339 domain-containing protein [Muribaculaceae bacterium]|nr:DUF4339 domain-containing protein [Muribaculaceae bacterium]